MQSGKKRPIKKIKPACLGLKTDKIEQAIKWGKVS